MIVCKIKVKEDTLLSKEELENFRDIVESAGNDFTLIVPDNIFDFELITCDKIEVE